MAKRILIFIGLFAVLWILLILVMPTSKLSIITILGLALALGITGILLGYKWRTLREKRQSPIND